MKRLVYRFYLPSDDTEPHRPTEGISFASRWSSGQLTHDTANETGRVTGSRRRPPSWALAILFSLARTLAKTTKLGEPNEEPAMTGLERRRATSSYHRGS